MIARVIPNACGFALTVFEEVAGGLKSAISTCGGVSSHFGRQEGADEVGVEGIRKTRSTADPRGYREVNAPSPSPDGYLCMPTAAIRCGRTLRRTRMARTKGNMEPYHPRDNDPFQRQEVISNAKRLLEGGKGGSSSGLVRDTARAPDFQESSVSSFDILTSVGGNKTNAPDKERPISRRNPRMRRRI